MEDKFNRKTTVNAYIEPQDTFNPAVSLAQQTPLETPSVQEDNAFHNVPRISEPHHENAEIPEEQEAHRESAGGLQVMHVDDYDDVES